MGGILAFAFVVFFIWRHRRNRKRQSGVTSTTLTEHQQPGEKAQLHSDEYKPHREELEVSHGLPRVRQVGELTELEYAPYSGTRPEMAANEGVGSELNSQRSPVTDSTTLVGSSSRDEVHR